MQPEKFLKKDTIVVVGVTKNKRDLKPITGVIKGYGAYEEGLKDRISQSMETQKDRKLHKVFTKKDLKTVSGSISMTTDN